MRIYRLLAIVLQCCCFLTVTFPSIWADEISERVARQNATIEAAVSTILKTGHLSDVAAELENEASVLQAAHDQLLRLHREEESSFAMLRSGDCLRMLGHARDALDRYHQALAEAQRAGSIQNQAKIWLSIEKAQRLGLNNHRGAQEAIDELTKLVEHRADLWPIQIDLLGEQATLELQEGKTATALITIQQAVDDSRQHDSQEKLWLNLYTRSAVKFALLDSLRQQFDKLRVGDNLAWAGCEKAARDIRATLQDVRNDTQQASDIAKSLGHLAFADSMNSEMPQYDTVERSFEAQVLVKKMSSDPVLRRNQGSAAVVPWQPQSVPLLDPAVTTLTDQVLNPEIQVVRQALQDERRPESVTWRRRFLEGQLEEVQNHVSEALDLYRKAADMVEAERRTISDEFSRGSFAAERIELYNRLVLNLLQKREYPEALLRMEQFRSRATMDALSNVNIRFKTATEKTLYRDWVVARSHEAGLAREPGVAYTEVANAEAATRAVIDRIRKQAPKLLELGNSQPVSLTTLQQSLQQTPCDMFYYLLHEERLILWHIGPSSIGAQAFYAPKSEFNNLMHRMMEDWDSKADFDQEAAARLYDYLARPALALMETTHLVIIPPPQLESLPFEALFDSADKQFLGEQIALSYGPSASLIASLKPTRALRPAKLLLVVGPGLETHGSEAQFIASKYPQSQVLSNRTATFDQLLADADGKTAIHLAAHAKYNSSSPMLSSIEFAGHNTDKVYVTAAQLFALPLKNVAVLTLGACSAGRSGEEASGDTYGFVRSLLYAGAQSMVLPLWKVSDEAASFWYQSFYVNALDHDVAEAARLANSATRRHNLYGSHPRYWAAYRVIGR